jgi:rubredoxin
MKKIKKFLESAKNKNFKEKMIQYRCPRCGYKKDKFEAI